MSSLCGTDCTKCSFNEECMGCSETSCRPFGGDCVLKDCCLSPNREELINNLKQTIIEEFNDLKIKDMPDVTDLNLLRGNYINLEYTLDNGNKVKLLDDSKIYYGNQLPKLNSKLCYGIVADKDNLLVCTYEELGTNPKIIIYKKR